MDNSGSPLNPKSFLSNLSLRHTSRILKQQNNILAFVKQKNSVKQSTWSSILLFFKTKTIEPYYLVTRPHETAFRYFFYFLIGKHHLFLPIFNFFQDKKHDVHVKHSIFHDCYFCCYDDYCPNVENSIILKCLFLNLFNFATDRSFNSALLCDLFWTYYWSSVHSSRWDCFEKRNKIFKLFFLWNFFIYLTITVLFLF